MPLIRRIPKRGFNNKRFGTRYLAVNLSDLNGFDDGATVDIEAIKQKQKAGASPLPLVSRV